MSTLCPVPCPLCPESDVEDAISTNTLIFVVRFMSRVSWYPMFDGDRFQPVILSPPAFWRAKDLCGSRIANCRDPSSSQRTGLLRMTGGGRTGILRMTGDAENPRISEIGRLQACSHPEHDVLPSLTLQSRAARLLRDVPCVRAPTTNVGCGQSRGKPPAWCTR